MWKFIQSSNQKSNWLNSHRKEICFIGRSNVGKSSLINAITNNQNLAKTSNTPGRTQLINFFQEKNKTIVDLPGYGFAKLPVQIKKQMGEMTKEYFKNRTQLVFTFLLVDGKIGPTKDDVQMIEYLKHLSRELMVIVTKMDKVNQSQKHFTTQNLEKLNLSYLQVSSKSGLNIKKTRAIVKSLF